MSLWVRAQDKKRFSEVVEVLVDGKKVRSLSQQHPMGMVLGKYESEAQAVSVLDEMQKKLKDSTRYYTVYEMPQQQQY